MAPDPARAEIVVDLAAVRHNVRLLRGLTGPDVAMMTVVKADGYGHGMSAVAAAARTAGATWLGVATVEEALALREAGDTGRLLCWLGVPGEDYSAALAGDIDVTAYSQAELAEIEDAARATGVTARLQLKVDTGLARGGARLEDWPDLVAAAAKAESVGLVRVTGVWSHFACSDEPRHPANDDQQRVFEEALEITAAAGLTPEVRHLANSAATVLRPGSHYDLVRCGIASYGLDPAPGETAPDLGLVPAMTVRARLSMVKRLRAGDSVSYGHRWTAPYDTTVGLVPAGYGDGVPRIASDRVSAWAAGARRPLRGRVCMDQVVVELGDAEARPGDEVVLFGTGAGGGPTATEWAQACETINYEIVTRIGGRFTRTIVDSEGTQP
ncbi:alanine racemase [Nocardioides donggukensis]|uniref:Alanine racemase n=1 Tax=Nocardioides donggukensis TaxID=2774019 RepID=A0A927K649_9ACTN|nr:alanine racemase [Nocardioides donggukensis]MBD8868541.1 alanine racemase [Nocardioides donggukensis]